MMSRFARVFCVNQLVAKLAAPPQTEPPMPAMAVTIVASMATPPPIANARPALTQLFDIAQGDQLFDVAAE